MSNILQKSKKKKIEANHSTFVFNFQSINIYVFFSILFVVSLFIGYIYSDDKYCHFNQLPDDRNELTPIKSINLSVNNKCVLKTEIEIESIITQTFSNLFRNVNVNIIEENQKMTEKLIISTENADSVTKSNKYFCFYKKISEYHDFTAQVYLFSEPISKKYKFSC